MARGEGSLGVWDGRDLPAGRLLARGEAWTPGRPARSARASREWWLWGQDPAGMLTYLMQACRDGGSRACYGADAGAVAGRLMRVLAGNCPILQKALAGFGVWDLAFSFLPRIGRAVERHEASDAGRFGKPCRELAAYAGKIREAIGDPFLLRRGGPEWHWCRHGQAAPRAPWPAWLTPAAQQMAQVIERDGQGGFLDTVGLAALADRLEEDGCTLAPLLAHLRGGEACPLAARFDAEACKGHPSGQGGCKRCGGAGMVRQEWPHGPACWALDMVLGRGRAFA